MLSSLRQPVRTRLSRVLAGRTCSVSTSSAGHYEALDVLDLLGAESPVVASEPVVPNKILELDTMHHYIPPAQSPILQLLTTHIMKSGKYANAQKSVTQMLLHLHAMTRSPPVPIVEQAVLLASPSIRLVRQTRGGGKQVIKPMALSERQRTSQGIKWIVRAVTIKKPVSPGKTIAERLAREIVDILKGTSSVIGKKTEEHTIATVNRGNLPSRRT